MIFDGRLWADKIKTDLTAKFKTRPPARLEVILVGADPASLKFVAIKERFGATVGVNVRRHEFPQDVLVEDLKDLLKRLAADPQSSGIIIQLPLPAHLSREQLLNLIPPAKDVDALSNESRVLAPVVAAVKEILDSAQIKLAGQRVVVMGKGYLVGQPVAIWLTQEGANVQVIDSRTKNLTDILNTAEIIITGIGVPHFIKPEMITDGVILIDAGTSEAGGELRGDADPTCAAKCALFTPVPGGVGPLTVAKLFENLYYLISG